MHLMQISNSCFMLPVFHDLIANLPSSLLLYCWDCVCSVLWGLHQSYMEWGMVVLLKWCFRGGSLKRVMKINMYLSFRKSLWEKNVIYLEIFEHFLYYKLVINFVFAVNKLNMYWYKVFFSVNILYILSFN